MILGHIRQFSIIAVFLFLLVSNGQAQEAVRSIHTSATHALLMDASTGDVLLDKNARERLHPSSMTKIMTAYLVFKKIQEGRVKLSDTFIVSERAYSMEGSRMFLEVGQMVSVEELLKGVIIQSGNDAAVVLAEGISGNEREFAEEMTQLAHQMGAKDTYFVNGSGLPDDRHLTTAQDLAIISYRLMVDFPEFYKWFSEKEFAFNGVNQGNRNPLLYKNMGADGVKTGKSERGGFGLVGSVVQKGRRLIVVLNGLQSMNERAQEAEKIITWGMNEFDTVVFAHAHQVIDRFDVSGGVAPFVQASTDKDIISTVLRDEKHQVKATIKYLSPLMAPIQKGQTVGQLIIQVPGKQDKIFPLVAHESIDQAVWIKRLINACMRVIWGAEGAKSAYRS